MSRILLLLPLPLFLLAPTLAASEALPGLETLIVPMIIIIVLVLLNGFFVAAEFAIIGVRPSEVDRMVQDGNGKALEIQSIQDSPEKQDRLVLRSRRSAWVCMASHA
jgi:hypothetical protein